MELRLIAKSSVDATQNVVRESNSMSCTSNRASYTLSTNSTKCIIICVGPVANKVNLEMCYTAMFLLIYMHSDSSRDHLYPFWQRDDVGQLFVLANLRNQNVIDITFSGVSNRF